MFKTIFMVALSVSVFAREVENPTHVPVSYQKPIALLQQQAILSADLRRLETTGKNNTLQAEKLKAQLENVLKQLNKYNTNKDSEKQND